MTIRFLAFAFGLLELAFVLLVAGVLPTVLFLLWAGGASVLLMLPQLRDWKATR